MKKYAIINNRKWFENDEQQDATYVVKEYDTLDDLINDTRKIEECQYVQANGYGNDFEIVSFDDRNIVYSAGSETKFIARIYDGICKR